MAAGGLLVQEMCIRDRFRRGTMQIIPFLREFSKAKGNLDDNLRERMTEKENREAILAARAVSVTLLSLIHIFINGTSNIW